MKAGTLADQRSSLTFNQLGIVEKNLVETLFFFQMGFLHLNILFIFFIQHVHHFQVVYSDGFLVVSKKLWMNNCPGTQWGRPWKEDLTMPVYPSEYCPATNAANNEKKRSTNSKNRFFWGRETMPQASTSMNFRTFFYGWPTSWLNIVR